MIAPLRERLAQLLAEACHQDACWRYLVHEPWLRAADALLASEEWQAREAVVEAAQAYVQSDTATGTLETWHAMVDAVARLDAGKGATPPPHSLMGIDPGYTGDLSSEEYTRKRWPR